MLRVTGLGCELHGKMLFENLNFTASEGEKIILLGQNGSGKSTLLAMLNGLIPPDVGRIAYDGHDLTPKSLKDPALARRFRLETGLVFQDPTAMLFHANVYDELAFGPTQAGRDKVKEEVMHCAEHFGILHLLETAPYQLSGGERQKVALACVMINRPKLLLLDEPAANLDPASTGWLIDTLANLKATVITSVHHLSMARELGQRALVLGEGGLLFDGHIDDFTHNLDLMVRAGLAHKHGDKKSWHVHDWG